MAEKEKKTKDDNKKGLGASVFRILIVVLMVVIVVLLLMQRMTPPVSDLDGSMEASVKARLGQLENKSEEEIIAELNRVIEEGMFHVAINARPVFQNGEAEGNLEIENVPNNLYTMRVEIALNDTGEVVYDSGLIEPNYHVQSDSLRTALSAGVYPATATFYAYDPETLEEMGNVGTQITIYVIN